MERGLGILKPASSKTTSEIIRSTGRFEGINGMEPRHPSIFQSKRGNLGQEEWVRELSVYPFLQSDFLI
jgi:hypothetical protein